MEDSRNLFKGAVKLQRLQHAGRSCTRIITAGDFFDLFVLSAHVYACSIGWMLALTTSAPRSPRSIVHVGPART
jgi:hypothetical protein